MFDIDPVYVFYGFAAVSAILFVEGLYLLFFSTSSYRSRINRRLALMTNQPDREGILVQLRRERGLTSGGDYRLPLVSLSRLVLQSGLTIGFTKLLIFIAIGAVTAFGSALFFFGDWRFAAGAGFASATILPYLFLRIKRGRRQKAFGAQFPDAIDIIVRSLRAGHPVPIAISMVGRELPDPIGSEFGIASDEITYGADLETAMRNLYFRVGTDDLPLFVTATRIRDHPVIAADRDVRRHQCCVA